MYFEAEFLVMSRSEAGVWARTFGVPLTGTTVVEGGMLYVLPETITAGEPGLMV